MPTEVHGLPEPPSGFEAVMLAARDVRPDDTVLSSDGSTWVPVPDWVSGFQIVARRKWEPKPLDKVSLGGEKCTFVSDAGKYGCTQDCCVTLVDSRGNRLSCNMEDIGPWIDEAESPAEKPTDDVGEGYTRIAWDAENPPVRMEGDEFLGTRGKWLKLDSCFGNHYDESNFRLYPNRRRPTVKPWSPPEWANGLGWMTQNCLGDVWFSSTQPVLSFGGTVYVGTRHGDNGSMSIKTAKALGLYPPDWDTKPASERCLKLGGD